MVNLCIGLLLYARRALICSVASRSPLRAVACSAPAKLCTKAELYNHSDYAGCCCEAAWCTDFVGYWTPKTVKGCGHEGYNSWSVSVEGPAGAFCCHSSGPVVRLLMLRRIGLFVLATQLTFI